MKRLRKSVCIILLMAILCSILPNTASAYTEKYWWWSDKEMLIEPDSIKDGYIVKDGVLISYEGTDTELVVPEGIIEIASWVFQHNDNYKSITLPYSLKKIGPYNFYYCKNLEKVVFEEEVGEIDHDCFYGNDNLREVIFSGNIEKIGNDCFKGNSNNFGIKCHKGSKAYQYAIKNNIKISKLYGIDYQVEIEPRLSKIVNESNWQKMKGEVLKLFVKVSNCQEDNTSYDAEDSEKMRLQDTKVIVSLPAGMSFTDGTCEKDLEVGTVKIGEEKTVKTDIIISKSAGIFQALPVSVKLYSKDYQKEYYKNLSSYGTNVSGKEAKALQAAVINKKISLDNEIDSTDNSTTVSNWYGSINTISEYFVGSKHYIFYVTGNKELDWQAHVKVLNQKQEVIKSLDFPKITHYEKYGNAIVDNDGNYYLLCGHADKEHKAVNNTRVFAVFKYDNSMNETGRIEYKATDISQDDSSMRKPFEFGDCSIVIDQNQKMLIDCALIMYNGHQRSQSLCIDTRNMTNLDIEAPYCSHSLEQYIYKTPENKVFYVNKGDGYPRGMQVTLFDENQKQLFSEIMFHFGNMESYQNTKASIGGITELKKGYLFLGCSEKELSFSVQKNGLAIERNVFIQLWDKEFYKKDIPEERQLFVTEPRRTTGSYDLSTAFEHSLEQNHTDYGVLWLTNYKGAEYASASKIVKLTDSTVAVFWEKRNYTEKSSDKYVGTYYCIIDDNGNIIQNETEIQNARLSNCDNMIYDGENIIWTTKPSYWTKALMVHKLQVGKFEKRTVDLENGDFVIEDGVLKSVSESLTNVEIPDIVKEIGTNAFWNCTKLKEITIPRSVKKIGKYAFDNCKNLEKVKFNEGLQKIDRRAFWNCTKLKEITIPGSVKKIGEYAFDNCKNLEKVKFNEGLQEIGTNAFWYCTKLKEITIPGSVKKIGKYAFYNCKNLEKVKFNEGLQEIGRSSFSGCEKLKKVIIPKSTKKLSKWAFSYTKVVYKSKKK